MSLRASVTLKGQGMGSTVLHGRVSIGLGPVLAASGTARSYMSDVTLMDFQIDGSGMVQHSGNPGVKGLNVTYGRRLRIMRVKVTKAPATGFGLDFLDDALIEGSIADGNGTDGGDPGYNGFGVGTGAASTEPSYFIGDTALNNGNNGFLFEDQNLGITGGKIIVDSVESHHNARRGIRITGASSIIIGSAQVYANGQEGIYSIGAWGRTSDDIIISHSIIKANKLSGIRLDENSGSRYQVDGNIIADNGEAGIRAGANQLMISNNLIYRNGHAGISYGTSGQKARTGLTITSNQIFSNGLAGESGRNDGIQVDAAAGPISLVTITGNQVYDNQSTKTQRYGILFAGSAGITDVVMQNNSLGNNASGPLWNSNPAATLPP